MPGDPLHLPDAPSHLLSLCTLHNKMVVLRCGRVTGSVSATATVGPGGGVGSRGVVAAWMEVPLAWRSAGNKSSLVGPGLVPCGA